MRCTPGIYTDYRISTTSQASDTGLSDLYNQTCIMESLLMHGLPDF